MSDSRPTIYLDWCATSPIDPAVAELVRAGQIQYPGNPSSSHALGRAARRYLAEQSERLGDLCRLSQATIHADNVVWTSGGTEANNLALYGLGITTPADEMRPVVISSVEHPSIARAAEDLARRGVPVLRLPSDGNGVTQLDSLPDLLVRQQRPRLVSIMTANNETGVRQPIVQAAAMCRAAGVVFHTDAVQFAGKEPLDFTGWGVDAVTITAHKFRGPLGIGALLLRYETPLRPLLHGGFQQAEQRPGTESAALAAGLVGALERSLADTTLNARLAALQTRFENGLRSITPDVVIHGHAATRMPHVTNAALPGCDRQALVLALDRVGVCCASGSACASGSSEPSPTLLAMGLPREAVESSVRFSWGATTTATEIDAVLERINEVLPRMRK